MLSCTGNTISSEPWAEIFLHSETKDKVGKSFGRSHALAIAMEVGCFEQCLECVADSEWCAMFCAKLASIAKLAEVVVAVWKSANQSTASPLPAAAAQQQLKIHPKVRLSWWRW